ncbi:MAG: hypothetical protein ABFD54_09890 [Armatimonadota bacterium]|nr:hypothetical protein [bacterium]
MSEPTDDIIEPQDTQEIDQPEQPQVAESVYCIKCGASIKPGHMLCRNCLRHRKRHFFENCFGPAVIALCGFVGLVTYIVKLLI